MDLIVCDWLLPVLHFPEVLRKLRAIPGYEIVPLAVFVGVHGNAEATCLEAAKLGVMHCLTKPISVDQLRGLFRAAFGRGVTAGQK